MSIAKCGQGVNIWPVFFHIHFFFQYERIQFKIYHTPFEPINYQIHPLVKAKEVPVRCFIRLKWLEYFILLREKNNLNHRMHTKKEPEERKGKQSTIKLIRLSVSKCVCRYLNGQTLRKKNEEKNKPRIDIEIV